MSESRPVYATATRPYSTQHSEPVTLVTTKEKAGLLHRVETLSNQHRRGDCTRYALVDLETLEIGSIIAFGD